MMTRSAMNRAAAKDAAPAIEPARPTDEEPADLECVRKQIELTFWREVSAKKRPAELQAYLDRYPAGEFASLAVLRIEELKRRSAPLGVTLQEVIGVVAGLTNLRPADLTGPRRARHMARPRQVAMCLCKEFLPNYSLPQIGRCFGERDHTTVLHAVRTIEGILGAKNHPETEQVSLWLKTAREIIARIAPP